MVRKLTVVIGLAMSLMVARNASAIPIAITPVDLDSWVPGSMVPRPAGSNAAGFIVDMPVPGGLSVTGVVRTNVFFDGTRYTYVHSVRSSDVDATLFNTAFSVGGFTGVAGWDFSDTLLTGGTGTAGDFVLNGVGGQLHWLTNWLTPIGQAGSPGFDLQEIDFFFVSTLPPFAHGDVRFDPKKPYNLSNDSGFGTAPSLAPVPEPGSIALLGSGLVGLSAAMRRRRRAKG